MAQARPPVDGCPTPPIGNPFMWTGHRYDAAVGQYHTLFRFYDPTLGRWLQRDPIEYASGSINLYEYVHSSPIKLIDPLGLDAGDATSCPSGDEPDSPEDNNDPCHNGCRRLKMACIATGASRNFAALSKSCNSCEDDCKAACDERKTHDDQIWRGMRRPEWVEKQYKEYAIDWWINATSGKAKGGCSTKTDIWRAGEDGSLFLSEKYYINRAWRTYAYVIIGTAVIDQTVTAFGPGALVKHSQITKDIVSRLTRSYDAASLFVDLVEAGVILFEHY